MQLDLDGKDRKSPPAEVGEIRLNLRTGTSELRILAPGTYGDFPRVPQHLLGVWHSMMSTSRSSAAQNISHICDLAPLLHSCCMSGIFGKGLERPSADALYSIEPGSVSDVFCL